MKYSPVIILGMHRAGTMMLTRLLEELGLFVGAKKEVNNEAVFFFKLNEWIFKQANASWDNPYNFQFINDEFKKEMIRVLDFHLRGIRRLEFLGLKKFLKYRDIRELDIPWGWKDPRNTFTIDFWKEVFPDAIILHIYRNPIDVAESLRQRELKIKKAFRSPKITIDEILVTRKVGYHGSLRVQNIHEGIELWKDYVTKAISLDAEFGDRILHIKYEDFLLEANEILGRILNMIGLTANKQHVSEVTRKVKLDRRYVFIKNEKLMQVYTQIKGEKIMQKLNYSNIENEVTIRTKQR